MFTSDNRICVEQASAFKPKSPFDLYRISKSQQLRNGNKVRISKSDIDHDVRLEWMSSIGDDDTVTFSNFYGQLVEKYGRHVDSDGNDAEIEEDNKEPNSAEDDHMTHVSATEDLISKSEKRQQLLFVWHRDLLLDDCFVHVLSFLEHWQMARLRRVCTWWNTLIVQSDMLWFPIMNHYFVDYCACGVKTQCDDGDGDGDGDDDTSTCYRQFYRLIREMPIVTSESTVLKDVLQRYREDGRIVPFISASHLVIGSLLENDGSRHDSDCDDVSGESLAAEPSYVQHKLSVIMSIFNQNGYIPRLYHFFRVGYPSVESTIVNKDATRNHKCVPLTAFCAAFMNGVEREIYPVDESREPSEKNLAKIEDTLDDFPECARLQSVGIGVNTEGDFDPWIYYLHMHGTPIDMQRVIKLCPEASEFLNRESDTYGTPIYEWYSNEKGWAGGLIFYNAGFTWYYQQRFISLYNQTKRQMIVLKLTEQIGVY